MKGLKQIFSSLAERSGPSVGVVGIDVGASSIKVVELQERNDVLTLTTYGELPLGPYGGKALGAAITLEAHQEQEALVDVIRGAAVTAKDAVFAMPLSSSFITNVDIDADPSADLSPMVRVEARKVIPAPLTELTLDWTELDVPAEASEAAAQQRSVLIAAIQNSALERFKILMQFAGLENPPTEIECFSTLRATYDRSVPYNIVIDLGAKSAKLYIVHNGELVRMHRVSSGGAAVTEKIASELSLEFEAAEEKKQTITRDDADFQQLQKINHSVYTRAFREFMQVIREYERRSDAQIETIQLSGGASLFPGTDALLRESLRKEVAFVNPFSKVAYPVVMDEMIHQLGPTFAVSLGAALRLYE